MALGWKYERKPFAAYDPESFSKSFPDFMPNRMNPLRFLLQQAKLPERHALDMPGTVEMKEETDTYPDISSAISTHEPVLASENTDLEKRTGEGPHRKIETQIESFIWQGIQNRLSYRPARFNGTLHILSNQHQFDDDPTLEWKDGLHGGIQTYRLYGDHESYHRDELQANAGIIHHVLAGVFRHPH
jgi:hypothetical protein